MKSKTVRSYRNVIDEPVYIVRTDFPNGRAEWSVYRCGHVCVSQHETLAAAERGAVILLDRFERLHAAVRSLTQGAQNCNGSEASCSLSS